MTRVYDACVVGSGPAGIAAAHALLKKNKTVLMLDVGHGLPQRLVQFKASLRDKAFPDWSELDIDTIKGGVVASSAGVAVKKYMGSDYAYRLARNAPAYLMSRSEARPSYSRGGLSSVWGASILAYRQKDLATWPITESDLAPHVEAVMELGAISTLAVDPLSSDFHHYSKEKRDLWPTPAAKRILEFTAKNSLKLLKSGIRVGQSRIFLNKQNYYNECVRCNLCLYGCPKDVLFNSEFLLDEFSKDANFSYYPNRYVQAFTEIGEMVSVLAMNASGGEGETFLTKRLFIGAGIIPTAQIVKNSIVTPLDLVIRDSQYFLQPILMFRSFKNIFKEEAYGTAVAQAFIEIENAKISKDNIHLQLYTYSPMLLDAIKEKLPFIAKIIPAFLLGRILSSVGVIQGYLHSDDSGSIQFSLNDEVTLTGQENSATAGRVQKLMRLLFRNSLRLGFIPLPVGLQITDPGRGFHSGGTFPMSIKPQATHTDIWGRPFNKKRVHLIDASVFPTIPAATITLTVMANAHRIASKMYE